MVMLDEEKTLLQNKLEKIYEIFPWYKNYCPNDKIDSIKDLPLMTQTILEKHYYDKMEDYGYSVYMTSGTSKNGRKKVYYSAKDDAEYIRIKKEIYKKVLVGLEGKIKALADMGTGHAASTAQVVFEQLGCETMNISFELPIEEHIRILKEFCPDVLYTMPSILDSIVHNSLDVKQYGIKKIVLVGEVASRIWINKMAKIFGISDKEIYDTYGSIEIGTLAYYSQEYGKYILAEGLLAEGLRPYEVGLETENIRENESILVITSFVRDIFPAIRFITFDVVRDLKTEIINDKKVQTFSCIVKRVGKEIKHGEKISIYDIENVVYQFLDKAEIRVNVENNRMKIYISSNELTDEKINAIKTNVQEVIPEIGAMIRNHILDEIEVIRNMGEKVFEKRIKNKRIYG